MLLGTQYRYFKYEKGNFKYFDISITASDSIKFFWLTLKMMLSNEVEKLESFKNCSEKLDCSDANRI